MNLTVKAYAKVNLWLDITGILDNGYHALNTVMQQVDICDYVTVTTGENDGIAVSCDNPDIPADERNIAYKAAAVFYREIGEEPRVSVSVEKHIPLEAGMGGSSTDGAAVLIALNELYGKPVSMERLLELGKGLGADVPFCMTGNTAKCKGIGEVIEPIKRGDFALVIVKPDFSCSTGTAYKAYDSNPVHEKKGFDDFCKKISGDVCNWAGELYNIFEVLYNNPEIDEIKAELLASGALGAAMTGSGSAVFGVYKNTEEAQKALERLYFSRKFTANPV